MPELMIWAWLEQIFPGRVEASHFFSNYLTLGTLGTTDEPEGSNNLIVF